MGDPLSVTASVISVLQGVSTLVSVVNDIKDAPNDRQRLSDLAISLLSPLSRLRERAEVLESEYPGAAAFKPLRSPEGPLLQLEQALQDAFKVLRISDHGLSKPRNGLLRAKSRLTWPMIKPKIDALFTRMERLKSLINTIQLDELQTVASETYGHVSGIATLLQNEHDVRLLEWVYPLDTARYHKETLGKTKAREGTCQWLFDEPKYHTWLQSDRRTLWCNGIPGAGKTVLASIVIDALAAESHPETKPKALVAYCYLKYNEPDQSAFNVMKSILKQLIMQRGGVPTNLVSIYDLRPTVPKAPLEEIEVRTVFESLVEQGQDIYIVIDALDECAERTRKKLLEWLKNVFHSNTRVFITSRFSKGIEEDMEKADEIEIRANVEDMAYHIQRRIAEDKYLNTRLTDEQKLRVEETVMKGVDGVFLLVELRMSALEGKDLRPKHFDRELSQLPTSLQDTYEKALERLKESQLAIEILSWMSYAFRPLTVEEVLHALAIVIGDMDFDEGNVPFEEDLTKECAGLVTINSQDHTVRFAHYTVTEFIERIRSTSELFKANAVPIAASCITYLTLSRTPNPQNMSELLEKWPFLRYAVENWSKHLETLPELENEDEAVSLAYNMLSTFEKRSKLLDLLYYVFRGRRTLYGIALKDEVTSLNVAVWCGSVKSVKHILERGFDINAKSSKHCTATDVAISHSENQCCEVLLQRHSIKLPKLNEEGLLDELLGASSRDTPDTAQPSGHYIFLDHEVSTRLISTVLGHICSSVDHNKDDRNLSVLLKTCHENRVSDLEALLDNVQVPSSRLGRTSGFEAGLLLATEQGHSGIINILLDKGVAVDCSDINGRTPLHRAAIRGYTAIVRLLLDRGASVSARDVTGRTAWHFTCWLYYSEPHRETLNLLRERGSDPNNKTNDGGFNSMYGIGLETARFLLDQGVSPSISTDFGWTGLHWLAGAANVEQVQLLLERGADPSPISDTIRTPLDMLANRQGPRADQTRTILLKHGAMNGPEASRHLIRIAVEAGSLNVPLAVAFRVLQFCTQNNQGNDKIDEHVLTEFENLAQRMPDTRTPIVMPHGRAQRSARRMVKQGYIDMKLNPSFKILCILSKQQPTDGDDSGVEQNSLKDYRDLIIARSERSRSVVIARNDQGAITNFQLINQEW